MIQFGTIKFRRTFKHYFGQFVWIEKKVTIIVAFHFMKRQLKFKKCFMLKNRPKRANVALTAYQRVRVSLVKAWYRNYLVYVPRI